FEKVVGPRRLRAGFRKREHQSRFASNRIDGIVKFRNFCTGEIGVEPGAGVECADFRRGHARDAAVASGGSVKADLGDHQWLIVPGALDFERENICAGLKRLLYRGYGIFRRALGGAAMSNIQHVRQDGLPRRLNIAFSAETTKEVSGLESQVSSRGQA